MAQQRRRLIIPIIGALFFSAIIIGGAINGDPTLLVAIIVALLICSFVYFLRKRKTKIGEQQDRPVFSIVERVLIIIVGLLIAAIPFLLGILPWPLHHH